jgi:Fur family ferric uptake transcriptional regulator
LHGPAQDKKKLLRKMSQKLEDFVAQKKLNRSDVRESILESIVLEGSHFRAQDLFERLKKRKPGIGRATLYRNLPVFVASGVIKEGPEDSEGNTFYELSDDEHHDHIVCLDCGAIYEFHDPFIEKRQEVVADKMRFQAQTHKHVVYAHCTYKTKGL